MAKAAVWTKAQSLVLLSITLLFEILKQYLSQILSDTSWRYFHINIQGLPFDIPEM